MPGMSVCKLMGKVIILVFKVHFPTISNRVAYSNRLGDLGLIPSGVPQKNVIA